MKQTDVPERVGGIRWTIKDGIVYDTHQLLADVREMVRQEKENGPPPAPDLTGNPETSGVTAGGATTGADAGEADENTRDHW